jgi:hypothetical protein
VLRGPNNDWPLAVCDYTSVDLEADTVICDVVHEQCLGENIILFKNPNHKWYYLGNQDVDDLIVFRNTTSQAQRSGRHLSCIDSTLPDWLTCVGSGFPCSFRHRCKDFASPTQP